LSRDNLNEDKGKFFHKEEKRQIRQKKSLFNQGKRKKERKKKSPARGQGPLIPRKGRRKKISVKITRNSQNVGEEEKGDVSPTSEDLNYSIDVRGGQGKKKKKGEESPLKGSRKR